MMILGGIVFLLILVMVFFISRQNATQRQEVKQMELDAEAAASKPQPRMSDSVITPMEPEPTDDPMPGDTKVSQRAAPAPAP